MKYLQAIVGASLASVLAACSSLVDQPAVVLDAQVPERLFLQQLGSSSVIVKWRGEARYACVALADFSLEQEAQCHSAVQSEGEHWEVYIGGLQADAEYRYSVGGFAADKLRFRTAPVSGQLPADGQLDLWIVGDSGTESMPAKVGGQSYSGYAARVMAGYHKYREQQGLAMPDAMLMLGDNAYLEGTDAEWQKAVFDVYTDMLAQVPLWSTIGNHEMGAGAIDVSLLGEKYQKQLGKSSGQIFIGGVSTGSDPNAYITADDPTPRRIPYLDILSLPANAELGGAPSGTEQYYSFNHGNVHIISLDSQLSIRDELQRTAMKEWLEADLQANTMDWTIVIFHHPVYTKGSHDSDTAVASRMGIDQPILDLRHEFTPVFEQYNVDLTFSGHSHSYERSWYLHGHRGDAASFDASKHAELNAQGKAAIGHGDEAYHQRSVSSQKDDKVVYTVAGSSGHVKMGHGKLDHPAHAVQQHDPEKRHGLAELGSVAISATASELIARFVNDEGEVLDTVVIKR